MMGNPPYRPLRELERELERGNLQMAIAIARDFAHEHDRPIPLKTALAFLPLVAGSKTESYDSWACHWLERWLSETREMTIERAATVAAALADLPVEPHESMTTIMAI